MTTHGSVPPWTDPSALESASIFDCSSSSALVIGIGGVGEWLAAALSAAGAETVVADIDESRVQRFVRGMSDLGHEIAGFGGDLTKPGEIGRLFDEISTACSRPLRIMVNTAAVNRRQPMLEVDLESYHYVIDVDLTMPFFVSQAAAKTMIANATGGSIVHITSTNARFGLQSTSVYGAAKAGVDQLVRALAVEWAPHGIRVNSIAPGFLMTDLSQTLWDDPDKERWILGRVPLGRPGYPRELVGACLLLASPAGSFITGQTVTVDGGFLAGNTWVSDA